MLKKSTAYLKKNKLFSLILLISCVLHLLWFVTYPGLVWFDSDGYIVNARKLLLFDFDSLFTFRTLGYSLFLILSGAAIFGTLVGLYFVQLALGVYVPITVYNIIRSQNSTIAFTVSLLLILSFSTMYYSKSISSEQLYLAVLLFSVYFAWRYYDERDYRFLIVAVLLAWFAGCVRPVGELLLIVYVVWSIPLLLRHQRQLVNLAALTVILLGLVPTAWQLVSPPSSYFGEFLFWNVYHGDYYRPLGSPERVASVAYDRRNGPHSEQLARIIEQAVERGEWRKYNKLYAETYGDNDERLKFDLIEQAGSGTHFYFIVWSILVPELGQRGKEEVLRRAALEGIFTRVAVEVYANHLLHYFSSFLAFDQGVEPYLYYQTNSKLTDRMVAELAAFPVLGSLERAATFNGAVKAITRYTWPLLHLGIILGLVVMVFSRHFWFMALLAGVIAYHALVVSVFSHPAPRFYMVVLPLYAVYIGFAAVTVLNLVRRMFVTLRREAA